MNWFRKQIEAGVRSGVEAGLKEASAPGGVIERVVIEQMDRQLPHGVTLSPLGFVWAMAIHFHKHGTGWDEAKTLASETLRAWLGDEGIEFGNDAYTWDRDAAVTLANEYEIEHWEAAS